MITTEMRYSLTIETIKHSDAYDENYDLFNQGIQILEQRIKHQNYSEFTVDERELLEEITEKMRTFTKSPTQRMIIRANTRWMEKV